MPTIPISTVCISFAKRYWLSQFKGSYAAGFAVISAYCLVGPYFLSFFSFSSIVIVVPVWNLRILRNGPFGSKHKYRVRSVFVCFVFFTPVSMCGYIFLLTTGLASVNAFWFSPAARAVHSGLPRPCSSLFFLFPLFFCGDGGGGKKGRRERLGERARVMHNFGLTVMVSRVLANDRDARIAVEFVGRNSTR